MAEKKEKRKQASKKKKEINMKLHEGRLTFTEYSKLYGNYPRLFTRMKRMIRAKTGDAMNEAKKSRQENEVI